MPSGAVSWPPDNHRKKPAKDAKIIPFPIEHVRFKETRTVAFRLKQAA